MNRALRIVMLVAIVTLLCAQAPLPSPSTGGSSSATGTVTTVSVTTANGVSGSVATPLRRLPSR